MGSDKGFLLTSTFVPKTLSAPALGLYTCIKALKYIPGPGVRSSGYGINSMLIQTGAKSGKPLRILQIEHGSLT